MRALILAALLALTLAGCPAAHSEYVGKSCKVQSDCFKGEMCMQTAESGTCVPVDEGDGGTP